MLQNKRPLIIGVTGNIGSGKSTFCKALEELGLRVYSGDVLAKQRLDDPQVIASLLAHFSDEILETPMPDAHHPARIDHQKLADIVFNSPPELEFLNSLIHPLVLQDMDELVDASSNSYIVFEVPLLFEAKMQPCFDYIILIYTPATKREARTTARSGKAESRRSRFQMSDELKLQAVDLVIENSGSIAALEHKASSFLSTLGNIPKKSILSFYASNA